MYRAWCPDFPGYFINLFPTLIDGLVDSNAYSFRTYLWGITYKISSMYLCITAIPEL